MIVLVLLQKSEGGGLGIGSGTAGGLMTARGGATLLTRATAVLAGIFMVLCLVLVMMQQRQKAKSPVVDLLQQAGQTVGDKAAAGQAAGANGAAVPAVPAANSPAAAAPAAVPVPAQTAPAAPAPAQKP
jgi:preprotein translocase subunit SecG